MGSELDAIGGNGCKATVETYTRPTEIVSDARTPEWKETAGNLPSKRLDAISSAQVIHQHQTFMQVVPGSERWFCRVEGCMSYTWASVPYGYCKKHLLQHLHGEMLIEKPFPPVGSIL
jgi:hypothetical protein